MRKLLTLIALLFMSLSPVLAQDDLLDLLDAEQEEPDNVIENTFKGQRLINGHTVKVRKAGELEFLISHRFGRINEGISEFFGLDAANVRFSLEYGISNRLTAGIGRNSLNKVYDGFLKYNIVTQSTGATNNPFSITWFSSMAIRTQETGQFAEDDFASKTSYVHQVLVARQFENLSLQLSPTYVHRNKVFENQENDIFALGLGGRFKLNNRISINAEYFYRLSEETTDEFNDAIGIGLEIETGGHVFHLNFTNARSMNERAFITETNGDFFNGDIHFGFNISRTF